MSDGILDNIDKDEILEAVHRGVRGAIWKLLRGKLGEKPSQRRVFTPENARSLNKAMPRASS